MTLLAIPNISEGTDQGVIMRCVAALASTATVLDVHSDATHNRTVVTAAGDGADLIEACLGLAEATKEIDLSVHRGVHPRLGALDVCPFVPHGDTTMPEAIAAAREAARRLGDELDLPVFLYENAATRTDSKDLPGLRRGGLDDLIRRVAGGLEPDEGPRQIDPARGVVCVGARGSLIAFNVWLQAPAEEARRIAGAVRSERVRALGLEIDEEVSQVSMNLIDPESVGVAEAFDAVSAAASDAGLSIRATEIVGLVEQRFLPAPDTTAARLLVEPGRSVEAALELVR